MSVEERDRAEHQQHMGPGAGDRTRTPRRRTDRRTQAVAIVAIAALIAAGAIAGVSTGSVSVPVPVTENILGTLACPSPARCVAVGSTGSRYTIRVPYALWFADGAWSEGSPVPPLENGDSFLSSISCPTDASCLAVGRQEVPAPYFGAKSGGDRPLVETWSGRAWREQRTPIPSGTTDAQLAGVDCAASMCMAVGSYGNKTGNDRVLTQLWNGSSWKLILPPRRRSVEDPSLSSVSCVSATSCTAVGLFTYDLGFSTLISPLILGWNGHEWRFERSGPLGKSLDTELGSIACPAARLCVAVGSERPAGRTFGTFAEIRDGSTWRVTPTPNPRGTPDANLVDVTCPSVTRCVAVGYAVSGRDPHPLVESWNGSRWTIEPAPTVQGANASVLSGIRCTSPAACLAVGNYRQRTPTEQAFTATWDGERWTTIPVPGTT